MKQVTVDTFVRAPVGRWACEGTMLAWCADERLAGVVLWGEPSLEEVARGLRVLDAYVLLAPGAVVVVDARAVELDVDPLVDVKTWCLANRHGLIEHLALQVGLSRPGVTGTFPELRRAVSHSIEVFEAEVGAFARAAGARGASLAAELAGHVAEVREVSPAVVKLRALMREHAGNVSVGEASRALGVSARALQRLLAQAKTSFRQEQAASREASAAELLDGTNGTLAVVAKQMGISVGTLMSIVRRSTGSTPSEYRHRSGRPRRGRR